MARPAMPRRPGWRRLSPPGQKLQTEWLHESSGWVVKHCGHPTANWPYYARQPASTDDTALVVTHNGLAWPTLLEACEGVESVLSRACELVEVESKKYGVVLCVRPRATPRVILGCGKTKSLPPDWIARGMSSVRLVDLYTGNHYRARLAYARQLGGPHWILSAFHGLRRPTWASGWYDRTAADVNACKEWRRAWNSAVALSVLEDTKAGDTVVVLAGSEYWKHWRSRVEDAGRVVETPLEGMGIGQQLAWLAAQRQLALPGVAA